VDCCTGETVTLFGDLVHVGHSVCASDTPPPPPPAKHVRLQVDITDVIQGDNATAGTTQLKVVNGSSCDDALFDSGPVVLQGGETPPITASRLANGLSADLAQHPNCDCDVRTVDAGARHGEIQVDCRITFGSLGVCLQGTDIPPPGILLGSQINRNQRYQGSSSSDDFYCDSLRMSPGHLHCAFEEWVASAVPAGPNPTLPTVVLPKQDLMVLPNPVLREVEIRYGTLREGRAELDIFDSQGRRIRNFTEVRTSAGVHSVRWDALDDRGHTVPAGVYMIRLRSADGTKLARVVLVQ
jgi:hypothetical protein